MKYISLFLLIVFVSGNAAAQMAAGAVTEDMAKAVSSQVAGRLNDAKVWLGYNIFKDLYFDPNRQFKNLLTDKLHFSTQCEFISQDRRYTAEYQNLAMCMLREFKSSMDQYPGTIVVTASHPGVSHPMKLSITWHVQRGLLLTAWNLIFLAANDPSTQVSLLGRLTIRFQPGTPTFQALSPYLDFALDPTAGDLRKIEITFAPPRLDSKNQRYLYDTFINVYQGENVQPTAGLAVTTDLNILRRQESHRDQYDNPKLKLEPGDFHVYIKYFRGEVIPTGVKP